jgi:hypothetical protein
MTTLQALSLPLDGTNSQGAASTLGAKRPTAENVFVFVFDIDGTLTRSDTTRETLKRSGVDVSKFGAEMGKMIQGQGETKSPWDGDLAVFHLMGEMPHRPDLWADPKGPPVAITRKAMEETAQGFRDFHPGAEGFFDAMRRHVTEKYGDRIKVEFAAVSGSQRPIVENLSIAPKFDSISCANPLFDAAGNFSGASRGMNPVDKIEYALNIHKGLIGKGVPRDGNEAYLPATPARVPRSHMFYFGDGLTDVPVMKWVQEGGGLAVGIEGDYTPLLRKTGLDQVVPGDYRKESALFATATRELDTRADAFLRRQEAERGLGLDQSRDLANVPFRRPRESVPVPSAQLERDRVS